MDFVNEKKIHKKIWNFKVYLKFGVKYNASF